MKKVVKPATADIADTFRYASDVVCPEVAQLFKDNRRLRGSLFITEQGIEAPLISAETAKKTGRRTWLEVFNTELTGQRAVFILTDESKRRLWHKACVTETDTSLMIFLNADNVSCQLALDVSVLAECITLVQETLAIGYSKTAIRSSLFTAVKASQTNGMVSTKKRERRLSFFRLKHIREFQVATFIGSKTP